MVTKINNRLEYVTESLQKGTRGIMMSYNMKFISFDHKAIEL